jgi:hypothetical protein
MVTTLPKPVTAAAREAIRLRAIAAGKTPTTAGINATYAKNQLAAAAAPKSIAEVVLPQPPDVATLIADAAAKRELLAEKPTGWHGTGAAVTPPQPAAPTEAVTSEAPTEAAAWGNRRLSPFRRSSRRRNRTPPKPPKI